MKIKIEGCVKAWHWKDPDKELTMFRFSEDLEDSENDCVLAPYTIELEVPLPNSIELTARIVKALRKEKQAVLAEAAQKAAVYDDRINKLLALTNEVPAAVTEISDDLPF